MSSDLWKPTSVPTRRELEERKQKQAQEEAARINSGPRPIPGRPGWSIDGRGRYTYAPGLDPEWKYEHWQRQVREQKLKEEAKK